MINQRKIDEVTNNHELATSLANDAKRLATALNLLPHAADNGTEATKWNAEEIADLTRNIKGIMTRLTFELTDGDI